MSGTKTRLVNNNNNNNLFTLSMEVTGQVKSNVYFVVFTVASSGLLITWNVTGSTSSAVMLNSTVSPMVALITSGAYTILGGKFSEKKKNRTIAKNLSDPGVSTR